MYQEGEKSMISPVLMTGETPVSSVQTALTTGFTSIAGDMQTTITNVLPVILGVVGLVLVVNFAIKFFRRNAK